METRTTNNTASNATILLWSAFGAVYVLWGSTYLALRFVLETIPPFLMAGTRFLLAGSIVLAFAKFTKHQSPSKNEIKNASVVGFLLLVIGNGGVVWAEQYINSGITALIVTIEPVWVVLLLWLRSRNEKPTAIVWSGILLGVSGMLVLVGPSIAFNTNELNPIGVVALLISSISWAIGSLYMLRVKMPNSSAYSTSIQMLAAGGCLFLIGTLGSEWNGFEITSISKESLLGFLYLVIFGSLIGFSSYSYIVKNASPTSVSTYAYVNPIIAVFLGWWIGNERVNSQTLLAALLLITAVAIILVKPTWKFSFPFKKNES